MRTELDNMILELTDYLVEQAEYLNFLSEAKLYVEATN